MTLDGFKKALESKLKGDILPSKIKEPGNSGASLNLNSVYSISAGDWYSAKPYGFVFTPRNGKKVTMFLPISPNNLTITTHFATNVIPTLYGTVEEHSEVRYFDIVIEGTTGMAPKFVNPVENGKSASDDYSKAIQYGRTNVPIAKGITGIAGGYFAKTLGTISQLGNKALDLLGNNNEPQRGFKDSESGYVAFHNLYRFLIKYKEDVSGKNSKNIIKEHPLTFFNYKDGNQYDVAVRNFTLRRSVENPMLYYYSIQLRGYNLQPTSSKIEESGMKERLGNLGLDGVEGSSFFKESQKKVKDAKSILNGLIGGKNLFGL